VKKEKYTTKYKCASNKNPTNEDQAAVITRTCGDLMGQTIKN